MPMSAFYPGKRDVLISKSLSYLLRHGAQKEKLPIDSQGWVPVQAILAHNRLKSLKASLEDLERIVSENDKQRFSLAERLGVLSICANQGHTLKAVTPDLQLLDSTSMPEKVYHGTYQKNMPAIQQKGLSRMARNHIHLTSDAQWSKLGIRATCNVLIYIDTEKCLKDGFKFWKSVNGVVLCEGNDQGIIPPEYFKRIDFL